MAIRAFPLPPLVVLGHELHAYAVLVTLGLGLGVLLTYRRARAVGLSPSIAHDMAWAAVFGGVVVGRLVSAALLGFDVVLDAPLDIVSGRYGASSLGAFFGSALGGWAAAVRRGESDRLPYADAVTYAFTFGWIFVRLGCTVSFDHPGAVTDSPLGMYFPGDGHVGPGVRHNLGFYEFVWALSLSVYFFVGRRRVRFKGWHVMTFLLTYALFRFSTDFLRVGDVRYQGLTASQWMILGSFPALTAIGLFLAGRAERDQENRAPL